MWAKRIGKELFRRITRHDIFLAPYRPNPDMDAFTQTYENNVWGGDPGEFHS